MHNYKLEREGKKESWLRRRLMTRRFAMDCGAIYEEEDILYIVTLGYTLYIMIVMSDITITDSRAAFMTIS